jgi:hypothetical protein
MKDHVVGYFILPKLKYIFPQSFVVVQLLNTSSSQSNETRSDRLRKAANIGSNAPKRPKPIIFCCEAAGLRTVWSRPKQVVRARAELESLTRPAAL